MIADGLKGFYSADYQHNFIFHEAPEQPITDGKTLAAAARNILKGGEHLSLAYQRQVMIPPKPKQQTLKLCQGTSEIFNGLFEPLFDVYGWLPLKLLFGQGIVWLALKGIILRKGLKDNFGCAAG